MKIKKLFESEFDTISTSYGFFYIYKNPTSKELNDKHNEDKNNRGVIDGLGNLYIVRFWPKENNTRETMDMMLHDTLISHLQKNFNMFFEVDAFNANRYPSEIVLVQQARGTKDFYLSELYLSSYLKDSAIQKTLNKAKVKNPSLNFSKKRISSSI